MNRFLILLFSLFSLAASAFADDVVYSADGRTEYHTGYIGSHREYGLLHFTPNLLSGYPPNLDLRTNGWVSKIKNQGSCGSCWSFAITKTLESARLRATLPELDLAEQQMVSCDRNAYGCGGGSMDDADYIVSTGLALESAYPYSASNARCKNPLPASADKAVSWAYIGQSGRAATTEELKAAINTYGVIFVTVSAGGNDWGGNVTHMTGCRNGGTNHMVTLVGYNEADEFIIGNSWGTDWGENGFAYAKRGCNELASEVQGAAFIVYEGGPAPVPPHIRLPAEITIQIGTQIPIGVQSENGVTYEWFQGTTSLGTQSILWVSPTVDTVYKLVAKNSAGQAESQVQIKVLSQAL